MENITMTDHTRPESLRSRALRVICYALFTFCIMTLCNAAIANNNDFQKAFEASYKDPSNVQAALTYSEEAVKIGDYESAISPLERLLMFNPDLSNIRVEVGVLYYLLHSYDVANKHFSLVMEDVAASAESKSRAQAYLQKL